MSAPHAPEDRLALAIFRRAVMAARTGLRGVGGVDRLDLGAGALAFVFEHAADLVRRLSELGSIQSCFGSHVLAGLSKVPRALAVMFLTLRSSR